MDKVLDEIIARASTWPQEAKEELARVAREIDFEQSSDVYQLSPEEAAAIDEGLAQADRGEFASDKEMEAFFQRTKP